MLPQLSWMGGLLLQGCHLSKACATAVCCSSTPHRHWGTNEDGWPVSLHCLHSVPGIALAMVRDLDLKPGALSWGLGMKGQPPAAFDSV